ncbi:MAG: DUF3298 and DUF4163 domain-containing protein [Oscillospiraceae bacterium]|nr:DUF3298 and DUF4163 domain-containing protein [Oscillospiraceae bacterium]
MLTAAAMLLLLSGCAALENMPKPPKVTPVPTEAPAAAEAVQTPQAAEATPAPEAAQPAGQHGTVVRLTQNEAEAYDPEYGVSRILHMKWDSVRLGSEKVPAAAEKITETLAAMEEEWYTGSGSDEWNLYGYNNLLAAAEDDYAIYKEYGGEVREYEADRSTRVVRADDRVVTVLINTYYYLGGAHGGYDTQGLCFDAKTGERVHLSVLSRNPANLRTRLVQEMLRLVQEDDTGYYEGVLSLTEPANYETAFEALLRDGSWYLDGDGIRIFSTIYELGPYAAGIAEFAIPYDRLSDVLDSRWLPETAEGSAKLSLLSAEEVPEGRLEIVDSVSTGADGVTALLYCEGRAEDVTVERVEWMGDYLTADEQLWYCAMLQDSAVQLELTFPGDLPSVEIRYRDASGEHALLVSLSGQDGSLLLTEYGGQGSAGIG